MQCARHNGVALVFLVNIHHSLAMHLIELIAAKDAARILGVSRNTVIRMAQRGDLPATIAPGYKGAYLFDPADVDRLAKERTK